MNKRKKEARNEETPPEVKSPMKAAEYLRTFWDDDTIGLREEFIGLTENEAGSSSDGRTVRT